ncbi:gastrin-releasing peptide [Notolabrus celidotus]|uniref:gastrin-releasing peptide n=1 Tax=Notolabrus celidotus TaxID=1203425 RepID=UPI00149014F7|nr:gastrin-releasing peptide [Notolabrus celidotus]
MGGLCMCISWTWRPVWPVFIILATVLYCSESQPAADDGKMYPRGNHWAVGHLMGKKSTDSLAELQDRNTDYLTPSEVAGVTEMEQYERLIKALKQQKNQKQMIAERLLRLRSGWREEDRDKYLREMSNLLVLALRLQDNGST